MNTIFSSLKSVGKKVVVIALFISIGVSSAPSSAKAFDVVTDPWNTIQGTFTAIATGGLNIKEYILDPLAHMAARTAIQSVMRSVINWANSGFEGSPAFITNLRQNLSGLGDAVADAFVDELRTTGFVNSPFRDTIIGQVQESYRRSTSGRSYFENNRYDLDRYSSNPQAFLQGDFSQGGIRAWVHTWMNSQNNPIGALRSAENELNKRVTNAIGERTQQLNWSRGILSWCGGSSTDGNSSSSAGPVALRSRNTGCLPGQSVRTPGSLIHERFERGTNLDLDMLVSADEIDEVIGALMQGLINKMLGGSGLTGLSQSSSGGGRSALDLATSESSALTGTNSSFAGSIGGQIQTLETYRTNWTRIKDAAAAARDACVADHNSLYATEATTALERATTEITRAASLITELQAAQSAFSGNATTASSAQSATANYQSILSSSRMPTPTEISEAADESKEDSGTLYSRMIELRDRCD